MTRHARSRSSKRGGAGRGLVIAGGLAVSALAAVAVISMLVPFDRGFTIAEARLVDGKPRLIIHTGGSIAKVHVVQGSRVAAGELLATISASDLDAGIEDLRARLGVARRQQDALRLEIQAFNVLHEQRLIPRQRVAALEKEVASLEKETTALLARIDMSERRLAEVEIRAPVAGILVAAPDLSEGRLIAAGDVLGEITADQSRPVLEAILSERQWRAVRVGDRVAVFIPDAARGVGHRASARLLWISPRPTSSGSGLAAKLELDLSADAAAAKALQSHRAARVILEHAGLSIAQQVVSPLHRVMARTRTSTPQPGA